MRISDWSSDVCSSDLAAPQVHYRSALIEGVEIAYREAGDPARPAVLLLHGFPTSSHMFRELIPALAERYHVLAPDYPGLRASAMPSVESFDYSFDTSSPKSTRLNSSHYCASRMPSSAYKNKIN